MNKLIVVLVMIFPACVYADWAPPITVYKISTIQGALKEYKKNCGKYPSKKEGLRVLLNTDDNCNNVPLITEAELIDQWGNEIIYVFPASQQQVEFMLYSKGADGIASTKDDITNWNADWKDYYNPPWYQRDDGLVHLAIVFMIGVIIVWILIRKQKIRAQKKQSMGPD